MNKEEILRKAQNKDTYDEMENQIMLKGNNIAVVAVWILSTLFMLVKLEYRLPYYDVYSFMTTLFAVRNIYFGIKTHRPSKTLLGISWAILTIALVGFYIYDVMG